MGIKDFLAFFSLLKNAPINTYPLYTARRGVYIVFAVLGMVTPLLPQRLYSHGLIYWAKSLAITGLVAAAVFLLMPEGWVLPFFLR